MALRRKVFVGSLFEFSKIGQEEFLQQLRQQSETPNEVPLIFYNEQLSLFAGEVNVGDDDLVSQIISNLDHYLKHQGKNPNNLVEAPKFTPILGTTINDEVEHSEPILPERNQLVTIEDSSDEEVQNLNDTYWKPHCGEISILSADLAQEIANLSGCRVFFEKPLHRVKLMTGNIPLAMEKLKTIEDVLTRGGNHRLRPGLYHEKAVKLIRYNSKSTIRSVRMASDVSFGHPRRVIADFATHQSVLRARLAEVRIEQQGTYQRPATLDQANLSLTADCLRSQNFRKVLRSDFGDQSRGEPRSTAHKPSSAGEYANHLQLPNKFLPEKDAKRVSEWREQVDQQATPDVLPAEPLPESKPSVGRRRVAVESSSDEEDDPQPPSKPQQAWNTDNAWEPEVLPQYVASRHIDWGETLEVPAAIQSGDNMHDDVRRSPSEDAPDKSLHSEHSLEVSANQAVAEIPAKSQSKNVFDVLDEDNDDHDADTEESANEKSSSSIKQLNVTFEEPELLTQTFSAKGKSPIASHFQSSRPPDSHRPRDIGKKQIETGKSPLSYRQPLDDHDGGGLGSSRANNAFVEPPNFPKAMASPTRPRNFQPPNKPARYEGGYIQRQNRRNPGLIDVSSNSPPESPLMPPPGFDIRLPSANNTSDDLISHSRDIIPRPTLRPDTSNDVANNTSSSRSESSSLGPNQQEFNPQLTVPKRKIDYLREETKARLEAMSKNKSRGSAKDADKATVSRERMQKTDEYKSRKYHQTMSQKAPKPSKKGKKGQNNQDESKADKQARIAKAKADAYGDTNGAKPATSQPQRAVQPEPMSSKKRQILKKNDIMAEMHKDVLAKNADSDAVHEIVAALDPLLKATRAFRGDVTLEMQFGQAIMIDHNDRIGDQLLYNPEDWLKMLNSESSNIETLFTNKLTTNGLEIDRLLLMKVGEPPTKLWNSDQAKSAIDFEFCCYDKTGFEFTIILDQHGKHVLRKPTTVIGKVPLYCPAQVWDACVVISGRQEPLCPSTELLQGVEEFIDNLYITTAKEEGEVSVFHRLPKNGAFAVQAIYVRSVTTHECNVPDRSHLQLRLTELKDLLHRNHGTDKALFNSYEDDYETMISTRRLHYEVAVIHKDIEESFKDNHNIEIGTLTPNELSVSFKQVHDVVKLSVDMLEGMDWIGAKNYGTLQRMHDMKAQQHATVTATLPPNVATTVQIPMGTTAPLTTVPSVYHAQQSRLGAGTVTNVNTVAPEPITRVIRGVRAGTSAELYQEGGQYFYYGQGGARIPVVDQQLEGLVFDARGPVVPDDSASQIVNNANARQRMVLAQRKKTEQAEKPAGFW